MKKIAIIASCGYGLFNPESKTAFGGAEVQLYQYALKLAENPDYQVSFIVGDYGQSEVEQYGEISVYRSTLFRPDRAIRFFNTLFNFLDYFRLLNRIKADVYIQGSAGVDTGVIALYCWFTRKKFIYTIVSTLDVDGGFKRDNWLEGSIYEFGLRRATAVVAQTADQQQLLRQRYRRDSTLIYSSNFIPKSNARSEKPIDVLWVASIKALKRPELFLDLAELTPQWSYTMVTQVQPPPSFEHIVQRAARLKNVQLVIGVPFSQVGTYFSQAKLFVNTSTFEGFPDTFIQATMHGVPIVSLKVNADNFLDKYQCGACAHDDFAQLVQIVTDYLRDKDKRLATGLRGYRYAREHHDIGKNIVQLEQLF